MSVIENKASLRRIPEQIFNIGKLDVAHEVLRADYTEHIPMPAGFTADREGFKNFVVMWRSAVPDLHYIVTHVIEVIPRSHLEYFESLFISCLTPGNVMV